MLYTPYEHFITILDESYWHDLRTGALLWCHNGYLGYHKERCHDNDMPQCLQIKAIRCKYHACTCQNLHIFCKLYVRNSTASIGYDMRCNGMRNRFSPRGVVCFTSHRWRNSDPNIVSNSYIFQICCSMAFLNFENIQAIYTCDYFFYISTEYCRYTVAICL